MQGKRDILGSAGASPAGVGALAETSGTSRLDSGQRREISGVMRTDRIGEAPMRAGEAPALPIEARYHA